MNSKPINILDKITIATRENDCISEGYYNLEKHFLVASFEAFENGTSIFYAKFKNQSDRCKIVCRSQNGILFDFETVPEEKIYVEFIKTSGRFDIEIMPLCFGPFNLPDEMLLIKKLPKVSIITPTYNAERFIENNIKSVQNQTYPNVEHVIHDGGSTDGTLEILKKYNGKIIWKYQKNRGQSDNLNEAVNLISGDFVGVLDADDEYLTDAAEWCVKNMLKNPDAAVVYGDEHCINDKGEIVSEYYPKEYSIDKLLSCSLVPPAQAAFIRTKYFDKIGKYMSKIVQDCPDFEYFLRIGLSGGHMQKCPGFVCNYRWHSGSKGCQIPAICRYIDAKLKIFLVLSKNNWPTEISISKESALSGILAWGALTFVWNKAFLRGWFMLMQAVAIAPNLQKNERLNEIFGIFTTYSKFWNWVYRKFREHKYGWENKRFSCIKNFILILFLESAKLVFFIMSAFAKPFVILKLKSLNRNE